MTAINNTGIKRAALVNDLSCVGKCSLSVALPIISAYGAEAVALPTAVLSTHTAPGFGSYVMRGMTQDMRGFIDHWRELGIKFDCIYTGFFSSVEQIELTEQFIREFGDECGLVIVDPVLGDNGELYGCFNEAYVEAMRRLCHMADIITPNYTEAALLSGLPMDTDERELISHLDNHNVIITGVHRADTVGYISRFGDDNIELFKPRVDCELHGTGDVFTSAFCGEVLSGKSLPNAMYAAADFCDECIKETEKRLPAHWYGLAFEPVLSRRMSAAAERRKAGRSKAAVGKCV